MDESARAPAVEAAPAGVLIRSVCKSFGPLKALDDVTLALRKGEFFSLLGPSGCGKTTLLRIIGGFETFDSGAVLIEGEDCSSVPPYRRPTNMIFQHLALFPHMNVFENIAFGLRRQRVPGAEIKRRVAEALALVRLEGLDRRAIDQLSGGQKQRVAMARAIVNKPSVLLLDEPLGALDLQLRLQMQQELRRLHRSLGATFIFVTHDQGKAMTMSDRIAVMNAGRVQQVGTPEAIYERPGTRFVAAFIGHTNLLEGRVAEGRGGGAYLVDCQGARIPCLAPHRVSAGERVTLALRYEKLGVDHLGQRPGGGLAAQVVNRTYMGAAVRLEMRLEGGLVLTADVAEIERVREIDVGAAVEIRLAEGAAIVVAD